jgi:hypothetical protein
MANCHTVVTLHLLGIIVYIAMTYCRVEKKGILFSKQRY